ncbi:hypothetical protein Ancab_025789 [Ancistrocladus abbreviatus]
MQQQKPEEFEILQNILCILITIATSIGGSYDGRAWWEHCSLHITSKVSTTVGGGYFKVLASTGESESGSEKGGIENRGRKSIGASRWWATCGNNNGEKILFNGLNEGIRRRAYRKPSRPPSSSRPAQIRPAARHWVKTAVLTKINEFLISGLEGLLSGGFYHFWQPQLLLAKRLGFVEEKVRNGTKISQNHQELRTLVVLYSDDVLNGVPAFCRVGASAVLFNYLAI